MKKVEIRKHKEDFVVDGKVKASYDKIEIHPPCFLGINHGNEHAFYTLYGKEGNLLFKDAVYVHFFKGTDYCLFSLLGDENGQLVNLVTEEIPDVTFPLWACNGTKILESVKQYLNL